MKETLIKPTGALSRREFIARTSLAAFAARMGGVTFAAGSSAPPRKVVVGAMPWVYAATLPNRDATAMLPQIFADYHYAGIEMIELLPNMLLSSETIDRIGELTTRHPVKVLGCSFGAQMFE